MDKFNVSQFIENVKKSTKGSRRSIKEGSVIQKSQEMDIVENSNMPKLNLNEIQVKNNGTGLNKTEYG